MIKRAYSKIVLPQTVRQVVTKLNSAESLREMSELVAQVRDAVMEVELSMGAAPNEAESTTDLIMVSGALAQADKEGFGRHWFFSDPDAHDWLAHAARYLDAHVVAENYNKYIKGGDTFNPVTLHFQGGTSPCYMFSPLPSDNQGGICCYMLGSVENKSACYLRTMPGPESVEKLAELHTVNE